MMNRDIFPPHRLNRLTHGKDGASVLIVEKSFYARVVEALDNVLAVVLRAVVDD